MAITPNCPVVCKAGCILGQECPHLPGVEEARLYYESLGNDRIQEILDEKPSLHAQAAGSLPGDPDFDDLGDLGIQIRQATPCDQAQDLLPRDLFPQSPRPTPVIPPPLEVDPPELSRLFSVETAMTQAERCSKEQLIDLLRTALRANVSMESFLQGFVSRVIKDLYGVQEVAALSRPFAIAGILGLSEPCAEALDAVSRGILGGVTAKLVDNCHSPAITEATLSHLTRSAIMPVLEKLQADGRLKATAEALCATIVRDATQWTLSQWMDPERRST